MMKQCGNHTVTVIIKRQKEDASQIIKQNIYCILYNVAYEQQEETQLHTTHFLS